MGRLRRAWRGRLYDGRRAVGRPAILRLSGAGCLVGPRGRRGALWPYDSVRWQGGSVDGETVRLECTHGSATAAFVTRDATMLEALRSRAPGLVAGLHVPSAVRPRVVLLAAVGCAVGVAGFAMWRWGLPSLARTAAAHLPVSWEERLGENLATIMAPRSRRIREGGVVAPLGAIVARLAAAEQSPYRFRVIVLKSDVVNAFALPGGMIVVCRGLLDEAARAEQVAGVLAHEMSHIRRRHQTVLYFERSALDALLALVGWTSGTVATRGLRLGARLGELHYSRENEAEADRMGFDLMVRARIDPRGMGEFLRILDEINGSGGTAVELVSTHPETGKRIEDMRGREALVRSRTWEAVMAPRAWKAFREALRATPP